MIAHIWFLRERERILGIIRDAWTVSIFLHECILQSGIGDPLNRHTFEICVNLKQREKRKVHIKWVNDDTAFTEISDIWKHVEHNHFIENF